MLKSISRLARKEFAVLRCFDHFAPINHTTPPLLAGDDDRDRRRLASEGEGPGPTNDRDNGGARRHYHHRKRHQRQHLDNGITAAPSTASVSEGNKARDDAGASGHNGHDDDKDSDGNLRGHHKKLSTKGRRRGIGTRHDKMAITTTAMMKVERLNSTSATPPRHGKGAATCSIFFTDAPSLPSPFPATHGGSLTFLCM